MSHVTFKSSPRDTHVICCFTMIHEFDNLFVKNFIGAGFREETKKKLMKQLLYLDMTVISTHNNTNNTFRLRILFTKFFFFFYVNF